MNGKNETESQVKSETQAYTQCLSLLSRREYSQLELRQKMAQKGVDDSVMDAVLTRLQEDGYQSDVRFTESFTRSRINKRHGAKKIAYELKQKGITRELANAEIEKHLDAQLENAQTLIERKAPRGDIEEIFNDFKLKDKITRSLVTKGYDFDVIRLAFETLKEAQ